MNLPRFYSGLRSALAVAFFAFLLPGCASIGTNSHSSPRSAVGQPYFLPKAEFVVALGVPADDNATLAFDVAMIGDTDAGQLHLSRQAGALSSDTVEVKVGENQLLTSVSTTFDSRAPEIATGLGEVIGRLEGAVGSNILTSDSFDPTNNAERTAAAVRLSVALSDWAKREKRDLLGDPPVSSLLQKDASAAQKAQAQQADQQRNNRIEFLSEAESVSVGFEWEWAGVAPRASASSSSADCGRNICVRAPRPGRLRVYRCAVVSGANASCNRSNGVLVATFQANIPNLAPVSGIAVRGGVFGDVEHTLVFSDGVLQSHKSVRGNELEGIVTSAGKLLGGIVKGTVDGLTGEKQIVEAQTSRITAQTALLEAQDKLDEASAEATSDGLPSDDSGMEAALSEDVVWVGLFGPVELQMLNVSNSVQQTPSVGASAQNPDGSSPDAQQDGDTSGKPANTTEGSNGKSPNPGG